MTDSTRYVALSLELHLFFARIMKEHAFFLRAGFTPADPAFSQEAERGQRAFEDVLRQALRLSGGMADPKLLDSGELFTSFTAGAETQSQCLTAIPIARELTRMEERLRPGVPLCPPPSLRQQVCRLNRTALLRLDDLIRLKESILARVIRCRMFTMNYPLLIEHILREANLYRTFLRDLEQGGTDGQSMQETELFWNQIMMEHAQFIRGLLDPTEDALIHTADSFAQEYAALLSQARAATGGGNSLQETLRFRDFKTAGAQGICRCEIRSLILPLLADHVLREANHYIRLLQS